MDDPRSEASAWETLESEDILQATDRTPLGEWVRQERKPSYRSQAKNPTMQKHCLGAPFHPGQGLITRFSIEQVLLFIYSGRAHKLNINLRQFLTGLGGVDAFGCSCGACSHFAGKIEAHGSETGKSKTSDASCMPVLDRSSESMMSVLGLNLA
ncbi:unnamed protein product [Penicillium discolor]